MIRNCQEYYNEDARNKVGGIQLTGRYGFHRYALKRVIPDIAHKLELKPTDTLLDIGSNCGEISIPLSFICDHVTCIDGEDLIDVLRKRTSGWGNISTISGDFMNIDIETKYDCILIYGVLVCIDSFSEKTSFIKKAAGLLKEGGRMLVGDVVNESVAKRFLESDYGKRINEEYIYQKNSCGENEKPVNHGYVFQNKLNDELLMRLLMDIRTWGGRYESFLLPQDHRLPFGCTRQDILIKAW